MLSLGPLSDLDAQLRVEIKRLHQRLGAAMIYVTHDQIEADRIAVMKDHVFQQIGSPQSATPTASSRRSSACLR